MVSGNFQTHFILLALNRKLSVEKVWSVCSTTWLPWTVETYNFIVFVVSSQRPDSVVSGHDVENKFHLKNSPANIIIHH